MNHMLLNLLVSVALVHKAARVGTQAVEVWSRKERAVEQMHSSPFECVAPVLSLLLRVHTEVPGSK